MHPYMQSCNNEVIKNNLHNNMCMNAYTSLPTLGSLILNVICLLTFEMAKQKCFERYSSLYQIKNISLLS